MSYKARKTFLILIKSIFPKKRSKLNAGVEVSYKIIDRVDFS